MKLIDQTPFFNEKGEISLMDRAKAFMDFGRSWLAEMEAQRSILPVLEKNSVPFTSVTTCWMRSSPRPSSTPGGTLSRKA